MSKIEQNQKKLYRIKDRMTQLTDHLFDLGHTISKPLMWDAAEWFIGVEDAVYEQGKMKGHAEQYAKDQAEGVEAIE